MEDWKVENVPVTLHLSPEAAKILYQYAGERGRGRFVSALLVAQRQQDEKDAERARNRAVSDLRVNPAPKKKRRAHR